jgi:hypothetical protein
LVVSKRACGNDGALVLHRTSAGWTQVASEIAGRHEWKDAADFYVKRAAVEPPFLLVAS